MLTAPLPGWLPAGGVPALTLPLAAPRTRTEAEPRSLQRPTPGQPSTEPSAAEERA